MSSYSVQSGSNYSGSYNENNENNENGSTEENYVTSSGKSYGGDNVDANGGKQGMSIDDLIETAKGDQGKTGSGTLFASLGKTSMDDLLQDDPSTE